MLDFTAHLTSRSKGTSIQQQIVPNGYELARGIDGRMGDKLGHAVDLDTLATRLADFMRQQIEVAVTGDQYNHARLRRILRA